MLLSGIIKRSNGGAATSSASHRERGRFVEEDARTLRSARFEEQVMNAMDAIEQGQLVNRPAMRAGDTVKCT